MRLLLDTCTFLWIATDAPELSTRARTLFADPGNDVYLSVISAWEMTIKHGLGKLALPEPVERFVPEVRDRHGVESLSLDEESALHERKLPALHRDPFDRLLVSQSIVHGLVLLTPDPLIVQYPVRSAW